MGNVFFVLPPDVGKPAGGYKVVYEYANRLSARGWQVSIGYDCRRVGAQRRILTPIKRWLRKGVSEFRRYYNPRWFSLSKNVQKFCIYSESDLSCADNIIATAYSTVDIVNKTNNSKKLYLIQGFENWDGRSSEAVKKTYSLGMENIVIAKWLKDIVDESCGNNSSTLIPNGIDMQEFSMDIPPEERKVKRISMLYHDGEYKGSKYGIQALDELKKIYPDLQAVLFGVPERPKALPAWIEYVQNASSAQLRKIYNESQIFLYPTLEEGFGLTCVESMACGCALCVTDYRGAREFAVAEENALISPVRDVGAMVKNANLLLENGDLRCRLAQKGLEKAKEFSWDVSINEFEKKLR